MITERKKKLSRLQSRKKQTWRPKHTFSSNSNDQKGSDMSTASCYSHSNSADFFKGFDMSALKSCSWFEGFDLDRFIHYALNEMVREPITYEKSSEAPELALEYFKRVKKGGDYEFVDCVLSLPVDSFDRHINFFARLKGKDSPPVFFFAELKAGCPREVTDCCIINPKPYSFGETPPPRLVLTHCKHVICDKCEMWPMLILMEEAKYACDPSRSHSGGFRLLVLRCIVCGS